MARPTKWRKIENIPTIQYFLPSLEPSSEVLKVSLKLEELEAIRLKDLEGLEQEECALKMEVSRPTFQRILISAREKVADSLINGKMIHIEGGNFTKNICPVICKTCGKEWMESYENLEEIKNEAFSCPTCGSKVIQCGKSCSGKACRKTCWKLSDAD